jgi:hypothetical protein
VLCAVWHLQVVKGMVLKRDAEGTVKCVENAKVAVYAQVGFLPAGQCCLSIFITCKISAVAVAERQLVVVSQVCALPAGRY